MTLASAMNAALTGLGVTARRAEIVSTNIANSGTEGYARRSLAVVAGVDAPGARAIGTERHLDATVLAESRLARADSGGNALLARQIARLESAVGPAGDAQGIASLIDRLGTALATAASSPASDAALAEVADSAATLARKFVRASEAVQAVRGEADARIAADTAALSDGLRDIAGLDRKIASLRLAGQDVSSLLDQRQARIDTLSSIVPVREVTRQDGQTMLTTADGTVLLDSRAVVLSFSRTQTVSADRPSPLQPLLLDGQPVPMHPDGPLRGGTLSAAFDLRDKVTSDLQAGLDALAFTVESRLRQADATLPSGVAGLLTDHGRVADPARLAGLSSRIEINPAVDPDAGGALWRLRSGLGAMEPAPRGDSSLLLSLRGALDAATRRDAANLTESLVHRRVSAEETSAAAASRSATLAAQLAQGGVNTDRELQDLMQIERAFAANARVLRAVDDMLQTLIER